MVFKKGEDMARILFVDDDPFTRETMAKAVQVLGHQPLLAGTGEEALTVISNNNPDLIFIDMMLPDMDGVALVDSLHHQKATHDIPILMLSAGPELDASDRAKAAGARDYLNKPIRLQTLLDVIHEYTAQ
jgi:CheY-like chemotaxis protein